MSTIQSIVDLARVTLQDPDEETWTDDELGAHVLAGVQTAFRIAPHLFFGQFDTMPPTSLALGASCPLSADYDRALADFAVARAHLDDDEDARDSESSPFIQLFRVQIGG